MSSRTVHQRRNQQQRRKCAHYVQTEKDVLKFGERVKLFFQSVKEVMMKGKSMYEKRTLRRVQGK